MIEKTIILILLPHEVVYLFDTVVVDDIEYKKMVWPDGITLTTLIFSSVYYFNRYDFNNN